MIANRIRLHEHSGNIAIKIGDGTTEYITAALA